MNPIEESLRRALEGGDPSNDAFRQSIYAASERAMERMIDSRGLDEERARTERARLSEVMERVEREYSAYYDGGGGGRARVEEGAENWSAVPEARETGAAEPLREPRAPGSFAAAAAAAPATKAEGDVWKPGAGRAPERRRRRGWGRMLAFALVLLLVLLALLYAATGWLAPSEPADPPTPAAGEAQAPAEETPPAEVAWIDVFSGGDLEQISTPAGGRVEGITESERPAVRLAGPEGTEGTEEEILINLGPGLVGELAGSDVRVELVAGSPDDALREFSVRCLFGGESICDRQRFATTMPEEAFVFDISVPANVSTPASLAIGPGLSPEGADVNLYSVRMRVL